MSGITRYYITDRQAAGGIDPLLRYVRRAIEEGVEYLQIREKDLPTRALLQLTRTVADLARGSLARILVNTRADVAAAAGAHGVHLPSNSPPPELFRAVVPFVAVSCHTLDEIDAAAQADFIVFGPVFQSAGKGAPVGLEGLRAAAARTRVPVFALGGVTSQNAADCVQNGAKGIAGITLFQEPES